MLEIERLALMNCNTNTIAVALDIPFKTLERHFAKKLRLCRAKYKVNLRQNQILISQTSADMLKFLGKNDLGQTDKQTIATEQTSKVITETEHKALKELAERYKLRLTGAGNVPEPSQDGQTQGKGVNHA